MTGKEQNIRATGTGQKVHVAATGDGFHSDGTGQPFHLSDCSAIKHIIARIGDKWAVLVVRMLGGGPQRFNELKKAIGSVSQRMLTLTLRGLERDGLVSRTVYPSIPPRVDYALTPLGHSLIVPIKALSDWAMVHHSEIKAAQEQFDSALPASGKSSAAKTQRGTAAAPLRRSA